MAEASQVVVEDVEAGDGAACESHEERVGGEGFHAEDPVLPGDGGVDQVEQDVAEGVDGAEARLEVVEGLVKARRDAEPADELAEGYEPGGGGIGVKPQELPW